MNKTYIIIIAFVLIIGFGVFYRTVFLKGKICSADQGEKIEINIVSKKNQWVFDPPDIKINRCDKVTLHIFSEDEYDHGFAIDVFGVNKRLNPNATTTINFTASRAGEFLFYCSVPCGEGHFQHTGNIRVIGTDIE